MFVLINSPFAFHSDMQLLSLHFHLQMFMSICFEKISLVDGISINFITYSDMQYLSWWFSNVQLTYTNWASANCHWMPVRAGSPKLLSDGWPLLVHMDGWLPGNSWYRASLKSGIFADVTFVSKEPRATTTVSLYSLLLYNWNIRAWSHGNEVRTCL